MIRTPHFGTLGAISLVAWMVFGLCLWIPGVQVLEMKVVDSLQKLRWEWQGPRVSPDIALIAIDDVSVDPGASPLADLWGRGGWLTRDLWVQQMQFHVEFFRPKVLAYDILFLPSENKQESPVAEALARLQTMDSLTERRRQIARLESSGNDEIENQLLNMADLRESGADGPHPVFAFFFPTGRVEVKETRKRFAIDPEALARMRAAALPPGVVRGGRSLQTYQDVLLPMAGITLGPCDLGAINTRPDPGGIVRRVPLIDTWEVAEGEILHLPSFALVTYMRARGIDPSALKPLGQGRPGMAVEPGKRLILETDDDRLEVPIDAEMRLFLNSTFGFGDVPVNLSYLRASEAGLALAAQSRALATERPDEKTIESAREIAGKLRDRVVFIGQAFTGSGDIGNFPLEESAPNVMAHVLAVDNLLRRDFLRPPRVEGTLVIGALAALAAAWAYGRWSVTAATALVAGLMVLYPVAAYVLLTAGGRSVHVLTPTVLLMVLLAAHAFHQFQCEARRRRQIRHLFSSMVSPRVLELMEERPEAVSLEGRRMEATMFFSDVAGFTSISEKLTPQELSALLNRYLTPMSDIIIAADGYVDKYEGDAIMAVWGVPYPDAEHALKACRAARDQLRALRGLSREIEKECGVVIDIRMGLNSGIVSAGNMGSQQKFQYTVMGDPVNLAARLEPINKDYGTRCILGPRTHAAIKGAPDLITRKLDRIVVKGKTEAVEIYELCEMDHREPWLAVYEDALQAFWDRRWSEAEKGFSKVVRENPGDGAARLMLERLAANQAAPPPADWNGAWVRTSKD
jgi:class 3 adenylate cyclase